MTRTELLRAVLQQFSEKATDEQMDRFLLYLCHEDIVDSMEMFPLICDRRGPCNGQPLEGETCPDAKCVGCIVQDFLDECCPM